MIRLKLSTPRHLFLFLIAVSLLFPQLPAIALSKQPANKEEKTTSKCTKYKFIGMRGSGQSYEGPSEVEALGPEMASLYGHLQTLTELNGQISYSGVRSYPAKAVPKLQDIQDIPEFLTSLGDIGPIELIKDYANEVRSCPDTKFIIAGYSQGAYAAHSLLDRIQSNKSYLRDSILGVILLANPTQDTTGIVSVLRADTERKKNFKAYLSVFFDEVYPSASLYLDKALTEEYYIEPPDSKFLKTMSFYTPNDVVADFSTFFDGAVSDFTKVTINKFFNPKKEVLKSLKRIFTSFKFASAIHSHYCAKSGKFAPKNAGKLQACSEKANKVFLAESEKYIEQQLVESKRLVTEKRQRVLDWYGKDWQVPTSCLQVTNKRFLTLRKELSAEFGDDKDSRLRVLAINSKDPSIWFVDELAFELVSYTPQDGFFSLETSEKMEDLFWELESFDSAFKSLSKWGLISNLVFEAVDDWRCQIDLGTSD